MTNKLTNDQVREMLRVVHRLLLSPYPFPDDTDVDERFAYALGYAAGVIGEALAAEREGRPIRSMDKLFEYWEPH